MDRHDTDFYHQYPVSRDSDRSGGEAPATRPRPVAGQQLAGQPDWTPGSQSNPYALQIVNMMASHPMEQQLTVFPSRYQQPPYTNLADLIWWNGLDLFMYIILI